MSTVATFVSDPARGALSEALLARVAALLPQASTPQWLEPAIAADIIFAPDEDRRTLHIALREALAGLPVDFILQPLAARRKKLLVADMDSTMIAQECLDELADMVGIKPHVAAITQRAMQGEIAFEPALRERVALLRGLNVDVVPKIITERVTLMPGAKILVETMRAHGAYTALVSGGFTLFTREIAQMLGFHTHRANELIIAEGKLTGLIKEPVLGMAAKRTVLDELRADLNILPEETLAVGDGANDLAMLEQAGLGVAFHAKPAVAAAAHARIDHCDLTALLFAQGYRRADFRASV
jgi:phosphoserine phosphatase